jgi:hypothetical protein
VGLGAGVLVPVNPNVRFSPSVGYVHYTTGMPASADLTVSYASIGLSVNVGF